MVEVALFVLVLAAVFALKAVSIVFTRDELVANSSFFSWMQVRPHDAEPAWLAEAEAETAPQRAQAPVGVYTRPARVA